MPFPLIPVLLGGIALVAGGYGIKKAWDASEDIDTANQVAERAKKRHESAVKNIEASREQTNSRFEDLGRLKAHTFSNQIKRLVEEIKRYKPASSKLKGFEETIEQLNVPEMEKMVAASLELGSAIAGGAASAALAGLGAYGAVGVLASASTGTAIASLSGVAATNATLAWLGGGALSAGGLGIAGGTYVLGGIVAGPALAVAGMWMASEAEEAKTKAYEYESEVDKAIAKIKAMKTVLSALRQNVQESEDVIGELAGAFDRAHEQFLAKETDEHFQRLLAVGKTLKLALDTPIMQEDGSAVDTQDLKAKFSGLLQCC